MALKKRAFRFADDVDGWQVVICCFFFSSENLAVMIYVPIHFARKFQKQPPFETNQGKPRQKNLSIACVARARLQNIMINKSNIEYKYYFRKLFWVGKFSQTILWFCILYFVRVHISRLFASLTFSAAERFDRVWFSSDWHSQIECDYLLCDHSNIVYTWMILFVL